ncbi:hypothetical protein S40288_03077 [Stachybotrys chartarum IBT 40288]|nr:hypothetical protein S40288_03077 [Stachybotrys chartarum IBT 40288]
MHFSDRLCSSPGRFGLLDIIPCFHSPASKHMMRLHVSASIRPSSWNSGRSYHQQVYAMEAAGLAIGIFALAGSFGDCVDLFSYFSSYRSIGRDYEILEAKLDVEKTLFLQWARRVRLLQPDYDERLDDPDLQRAIFRVLSSIRSFLSEGSALQKRYGLEPTAEGLEASDAVATNLSRGHLEQFVQDFKALQTRVDLRSSNVSKTSKLRWAINDKDKFEKLVTDLALFISKLNQLIPSTGQEWERSDARALLHQSLSRLEDFRTIEILRSATIDAPAYVSVPAVARFEEVLRPKILAQLWFRTMDDRLEVIAPAHPRTFLWALRDESVLSSWLSSGSGIFWLSGKAGSGKSTLMKHLYGLKDTKSRLLEWAGSSKLVLGSFFFWNLGRTEQRSHIGLSTAVLYQILNHNQSLIPTLLPRMWKLGCSQGAYTDGLAALEPPSSVELAAAFQMLGNVEISQRFCFFIDGLDEYEGNLVDGISFVQNLCCNPNIKILLSSRPIPLCTDAFSSLPMLRLQDITRPDISNYVHDKISSHKYMLRLKASHPEDAESIIQQLVDKSAGVFLWVILACRSILNGFAAYDTVAELMERVEELPPELEGMFRHMLSMIDRRYVEHTAKMLRICYQRQVIGRTMEYQRRDLVKIDALCWDMLDSAGMDIENMPPLDLSKPSRKHVVWDRVEGRLRSRCGGLLELDSTNPSNTRSGQEPRENASVVFMHRTVFEFLDNPEIWNLEYLRIHDIRFNANAALCVLSMQLWHWKGTHNWVAAMADTLFCARLVDAKDVSISFLILERIMFVVLNEERIAPSEHSDSLVPSRLIGQHGRDSFIFALAVEANMVNYVSHHIPQRGSKPVGYPLLYHALAKPLLCSSSPSPLNTYSMVHLLLSAGCQPNEEFISETGDTMTPWKRCVLDLMAKPHSDLFQNLATAKIMLKAGARSSNDHTLEDFLQTHMEVFHDRSKMAYRDHATALRVLELLAASKRTYGGVFSGILRKIPSFW